MKKMFLKLSDSLLSREQMKVVKGGGYVGLKVVHCWYRSSYNPLREFSTDVCPSNWNQLQSACISRFGSQDFDGGYCS
jgi:natural product precursor